VESFVQLDILALQTILRISIHLGTDSRWGILELEKLETANAVTFLWVGSVGRIEYRINADKLALI
jgi:hypothetical protein